VAADDASDINITMTHHHPTVRALLFLAFLYPLLFPSVCIALPAGADDPKMISKQRFAHVPMSTLPRPKTFEILDSPGTDICTSVVGSGRGGRVPGNTHIHIRYALFDLKHYDKFDHKGWGDEKQFKKPGVHDDDDNHIDRRRLNVYSDDYYYGGSGEEDFGHHHEEEIEEARRLEQLGLERLEREKKDKEAREASQRMLNEERYRAQQKDKEAASQRVLEERYRAQQEEDEKRKRVLEEDQRRIRDDHEKRKEEETRKEDEKREEDKRQRLAWEEEKLRRHKDEEQRREWEEEKRKRAAAEGARGESVKEQIKQPDGGEEGRPAGEMERKELPTPPLTERSRYLLEEDERQREEMEKRKKTTEAASRASEGARRDALKENIKQTDPRKEGRREDDTQNLPTPPLPKSPEERQAEQGQKQQPLPPPRTREDVMKNREGADTPKKIERVEPRLPPDLHDIPRVPGIPHERHEKRDYDSLNNALPPDLQDQLKNGKDNPEEIPPDVYMEDDMYGYDAGFDDLDEYERESFKNSRDMLNSLHAEDNRHALGQIQREQSEQAMQFLNGLNIDMDELNRKMEAEEREKRKRLMEELSAKREGNSVREEKKPSSSGVHIESGATVAALSKIDQMKKKVTTGVEHQGDLRITVFQRPHDSLDEVVVADRQNVRHKAIHNVEGTLTYITSTEATVDICVRSTYASKQHPSRIGYTVSYGHDESFYELRRAMSSGSHTTEEDIVMKEMYNEIRELEYDVRIALFSTQESKQEEAVLRVKVEKFYASARWWPIIEILVLVVVGMYQSFHLMCFLKKKTKAY